MAFEVLLGNVSVGRLEQLADGRGTRLRLHSDYRRAAFRPLLGQQFISYREEYRNPSRLIHFFEHLLPEGALRSILVSRERLDGNKDWQLLGLLGRDLPGAVRLIPSLDEDSGESQPPSTPQRDSELAADDPPTRATVPHEKLRFSLSGVQLKFSMSWINERLAFPADHSDGKWIVKLGDAAHPDLPEVEWSMMEWARRSGLAVPQCRLVPLERLEGVSEDYTSHGGRFCYAIERFDRSGVSRVHIEDFAQVFAADDKYQGHSCETIGSVVNGVCGQDDFREYVRRIVFNVLCGNGDAHLKNWSLIYPDGVHARLSPVYDLVSTIAFDYERKLALNFNRSKRFEDVTVIGFQRLARKIHVDEPLVSAWVKEAVAHCMDAWASIRGELPLAPKRRERIEEHHALLRKARSSLLHT